MHLAGPSGGYLVDEIKVTDDGAAALAAAVLRLEADWLGRISLRDFYLRRALRILPPMYLVLLAAIAATLAGVLPGSISVAVTAIQAVHLSNYYSIVRGWDGLAPGTAIYWSLAVEEHFYLMFPLTYIVLRRYMGTARRQGAILALVCFGVLAWRVLLVFGFGASTDRTYIATDTRIDSILFGCILAIYGNPALDDSRVPERAWKWALFPLAVVGLLISFLVRDPRFQETVRYSLQGLALFPLFVVAIPVPGLGTVPDPHDPADPVRRRAVLCDLLDPPDRHLRRVRAPPGSSGRPRRHRPRDLGEPRPGSACPGGTALRGPEAKARPDPSHRERRRSASSSRRRTGAASRLAIGESPDQPLRRVLVRSQVMAAQ